MIHRQDWPVALPLGSGENMQGILVVMPANPFDRVIEDYKLVHGLSERVSAAPIGRLFQKRSTSRRCAAFGSRFASCANSFGTDIAPVVVKVHANRAVAYLHRSHAQMDESLAKLAVLAPPFHSLVGNPFTANKSDFQPELLWPFQVARVLVSRSSHRDHGGRQDSLSNLGDRETPTDRSHFAWVARPYRMSSRLILQLTSSGKRNNPPDRKLPSRARRTRVFPKNRLGEYSRRR